jgi:6-phosphogluconolactonase
MNGSPHRLIIVAPDPQAVAEMAAQRLVDRITAGARNPAVCLAGGSTPKRLYDLLATAAWRDRIPWDDVHWFMGDDRFVAADAPLNNMAMARKSVLDACAPARNIHAIPSNASSPDAAAHTYENELKAFRDRDRKSDTLFDLVLMGIGPDGHTASLFPGAPAVAERTRWVVGVEHANVAPFVPRVSLTLPCLAQTHQMLFLITGHDKRDILRRVFSGEDLPAARAHAEKGETLWLLDEAAMPPDLNFQELNRLGWTQLRIGQP